MNLLEKYYLQGKGKLMAGIFVLVVLLIISTIAFTGCFSSGKKSDDKNKRVESAYICGLIPLLSCW